MISHYISLFDLAAEEPAETDEETRRPVKISDFFYYLNTISCSTRCNIFALGGSGATCPRPDFSCASALPIKTGCTLLITDATSCLACFNSFSPLSWSHLQCCISLPLHFFLLLIPNASFSDHPPSAAPLSIPPASTTIFFSVSLSQTGPRFCQTSFSLPYLSVIRRHLWQRQRLIYLGVMKEKHGSGLSKCLLSI